MKNSDDNFIKCQNAGLRLLSRRPHSVSELWRKLQQRSYSNEVIKQVVAEFFRLNYLDDHQFAEQFCEYRKSSFQAQGRNKVRIDLMKRGIKTELIDEVLDEGWHEEEVELGNAQKIAIKKWQQIKDKSDLWKSKNKVYRFLVGRGFNSNICRQVIENLNNNSDI